MIEEMRMFTTTWNEFLDFTNTKQITNTTNDARNIATSKNELIVNP